MNVVGEHLAQVVIRRYTVHGQLPLSVEDDAFLDAAQFQGGLNVGPDTSCPPQEAAGLFWLNPNQYLALDSVIGKWMSQLGIPTNREGDDSDGHGEIGLDHPQDVEARDRAHQLAVLDHREAPEVALEE